VQSSGLCNSQNTKGEICLALANLNSYDGNVACLDEPKWQGHKYQSLGGVGMKRTGVFYHEICGKQAYKSLAMSIGREMTVNQHFHP
jgi:hypothetical protein